MLITPLRGLLAVPVAAVGVSGTAGLLPGWGGGFASRRPMYTGLAGLSLAPSIGRPIGFGSTGRAVWVVAAAVIGLASLGDLVAAGFAAGEAGPGDSSASTQRERP